MFLLGKDPPKVETLHGEKIPAQRNFGEKDQSLKIPGNRTNFLPVPRADIQSSTGSYNTKRT